MKSDRLFSLNDISIWNDPYEPISRHELFRKTCNQPTHSKLDHLNQSSFTIEVKSFIFKALLQIIRSSPESLQNEIC